MRQGERWCRVCGEPERDPQAKRCSICGQGALVPVVDILPQGSYTISS